MICHFQVYQRNYMDLIVLFRCFKGTVWTWVCIVLLFQMNGMDLVLSCSCVPKERHGHGLDYVLLLVLKRNSMDLSPENVFLGVPKERNGPDNEDGHLLDGGPLRTQEDDQDARWQNTRHSNNPRYQKHGCRMKIQMKNIIKYEQSVKSLDSLYFVFTSLKNKYCEYKFFFNILRWY